LGWVPGANALKARFQGPFGGGETERKGWARREEGRSSKPAQGGEASLRSKTSMVRRRSLFGGSAGGSLRSRAREDSIARAAIVSSETRAAQREGGGSGSDDSAPWKQTVGPLRGRGNRRKQSGV
jgi:hypothetical protein